MVLVRTQNSPIELDHQLEHLEDHHEPDHNQIQTKIQDYMTITNEVDKMCS